MNDASEIADVTARILLQLVFSSLHRKITHEGHKPLAVDIST